MTAKSIAKGRAFRHHGFRRATRLQGESVMAYVRGRWLEGAMRSIVTEPVVRIVDPAFDCGFDSQEVPTRALARAFGDTRSPLHRPACFALF
jgi:hypothetical protein